ncbi:MAG: FecR domain-containing protein [Myxococcota bacterium]
MTDPLTLLSRSAQEAAKPVELAPDLTAQALVAAQGRRRRRVHLERWAAGIFTVAAVALSVFILLRPRGAPVSDPMADVALVELGEGDLLAQTPGTELGMVGDAREERVLRLDGGEAVFSVNQRVRVMAGDADVVVHGTVVAVRVDDDRTRVRVYEGTVEVVANGRAHVLRAGESYDSDAEVAAWRPSLHVLGVIAGRARESRMPSRPTVERELRQDRMTGRLGTPGDGSSTVDSMDGSSTGPTPEEVRSWLLEGDPERALAEALRQAHAEPSGAWLFLLGDCYRATAEPAEARDRYLAAVPLLDAEEGAKAGYLAADLAYRVLSDPEGALAALELGRSAASGSPMEERALALQARALLAMSRPEEFVEVAERYRLRFPEGQAHAWLDEAVARIAP